MVDARADVFNDAGSLGAKTARQRGGIEAGADVDVHEVHTDGGVAHTRLTGAWLANRDGFRHQHIRPAGLMETDSVGHVGLLSSIDSHSTIVAKRKKLKQFGYRMFFSRLA